MAELVVGDLELCHLCGASPALQLRHAPSPRYFSGGAVNHQIHSLKVFWRVKSQ